MAIRFRFRLLPMLVTVVLVAIGVTAGQWQQRRAAEKAALQHAYETHARAPARALHENSPALPDYTRVQVTGQFEPGWRILLDNRPHDGRAGYYVVMPLRIEGSRRHVLVARGWVARGGVYGSVAPYPTPTGTITLRGMVRADLGRVMELGGGVPITQGAIVPNLSPAQFAQASGLSVLPYFVVQTEAATPEDRMERAWPAPAFKIDTHKGYAFQWYALAVMALLFFVFTGLKSGSTRASKRED
jgi:cytochrome oxidase assembly protein ShyY1